ncbi:MAG: ribonuclease H family protein [Dysgonamonadaceae bacterium]|jgi:ribonuclease HI|nr:ribonuclease H family protein [Dysgonamonadaceae bacterium]
MAKKKFYTVWKGRSTGIFTSWDDCRRQVEGFEGALYKSFATEDEAKAALKSAPRFGYAKRKTSPSQSRDSIITESISVDAACSGNPGLMEYRGVETGTGKEIFHVGPLEKGTNNIGEFLAIVHALAHLSLLDSSMPVYSDSNNAILWVKNKKCRTKLEQCAANSKIFELIKRAERWLNGNTYPNQIMKWNTAGWGEIPADFGRK